MIKNNKKLTDNSISDSDFVDLYIHESKLLLDRLCLDYDVTYDDFAPICSLVNELVNRLSVLRHALS